MARDGAKGWELKGERHTWECAACGRQRSVTAGAIMRRSHAPKVVGRMAAHVVLRWTHRVFSALRAFLRLRPIHRIGRSRSATGCESLKRWGPGVFHGLRRPHLQRYLDEFVWRWNRRRHAASAFDALLGIGARLATATARDVVDQRAGRPAHARGKAPRAVPVIRRPSQNPASAPCRSPATTHGPKPPTSTSGMTGANGRSRT